MVTLKIYMNILDAMLKHCDQKAAWEEQVHLAYTSRSQPVTEGRQGRNLRQELKQDTMEDCCLLSCSDCFLTQLRTIGRGDVPYC